MLTVANIDVYYGQSWILRDVSLEVPSGSVVALLGRNGAGKSTTLKTIAGLVTPRKGSVRFDDREIGGRLADVVNRLGIAYVPEERRVFGHLTVDEHLAIGGRSTRWTPQRMLEIFPPLAKLRTRYGRNLSGGEAQMLAIARALVTGPKLLLLDEPSQGLAPVMVDAVVASIRALQNEGLAILLVEQKVEMALDLADFAAIIDRGAMVFRGTRAEIEARSDLQATYLGVGT